MIDQLKQAIRRSPLAGLAADLYRFAERPSATMRVWRDVRETWREAAFARALPLAQSDAPTLLVLSMTDNVYATKLECMLATAARRDGWRVEVLSSRTYTTARRLYAAYGIENFVYYEDLIGASRDNDAIDREVARRAKEPTDFQSVLGWTYRDAWIGPQLLSSLSRRGFVGAPDPREPAMRADLISQLRLSIGFVHAAEEQLKARRPAAILVNEPNYHVLGPFVDVAIAIGIPVVHYTQPSREDALVLKKLTPETRRIHPNSITSATFETLLAEPWGQREEAELDEEFAARYGGTWKVQARNQPGTREMSPQEVRAAFGLAADRPIGVVFSHVLWDANLFYGEDLFENYGHWFVETVRAAIANPNVSWLVKLHPANLWKRKLSGVTDEYGELRLIREHIGDLPDHVRLLGPDTPVSTLSLFRSIDFGVTVRGSVGYELPCFGVPVITAGTGRYTGFGFTLDHETRDDYLATLARGHAIPRLTSEVTHRARVHAHALFRRRPWTYWSFRSVIGDDVTDPLYQNLRPVPSAGTGAPPADDLQRFAHWLAQPAIDYLERSGSDRLGV